MISIIKPANVARYADFGLFETKLFSLNFYCRCFQHGFTSSKLNRNKALIFLIGVSFLEILPGSTT